MEYEHFPTAHEVVKNSLPGCQR